MCLAPLPTRVLLLSLQGLHPTCSTYANLDFSRLQVHLQTGQCVSAESRMATSGGMKKNLRD